MCGIAEIAYKPFLDTERNKTGYLPSIFGTLSDINQIFYHFAVHWDIDKLPIRKSRLNMDYRLWSIVNVRELFLECPLNNEHSGNIKWICCPSEWSVIALNYCSRVGWRWIIHFNFCLGWNCRKVSRIVILLTLRSQPYMPSKGPLEWLDWVTNDPLITW